MMNVQMKVMNGRLFVVFLIYWCYLYLGTVEMIQEEIIIIPCYHDYT